MCIRKILIILASIMFPTLLYAQKVHTISGTYKYHLPEDVSQDKAKYFAVEQAKIQALTNKYGTLVSEHNTLVQEDINGNSAIDFYSLGSTLVKGEWLEDTKEPKCTISIDQTLNCFVITASVEGKAREIKTAAIDFSAEILRNGTEKRFENYNFKNGDDLYLSFQTPTSGYLAVYLLDAEKTAYCLLPYRGDTDGQVAVKNNHQYIFFSEQHAEEKMIIDEYYLTCERNHEINMIYILFSPKPFIKANDIQGRDNMPRQLDFADFQKWLTKNRIQDPMLQVDIRPVVIEKK